MRRRVTDRAPPTRELYCVAFDARDWKLLDKNDYIMVDKNMHLTVDALRLPA